MSLLKPKQRELLPSQSVDTVSPVDSDKDNDVADDSPDGVFAADPPPAAAATAATADVASNDAENSPHTHLSSHDSIRFNTIELLQSTYNSNNNDYNANNADNISDLANDTIDTIDTHDTNVTNVTNVTNITNTDDLPPSQQSRTSHVQPRLSNASKRSSLPPGSLPASSKSKPLGAMSIGSLPSIPSVGSLPSIPSPASHATKVSNIQMISTNVDGIASSPHDTMTPITPVAGGSGPLSSNYEQAGSEPNLQPQGSNRSHSNLTLSNQTYLKSLSKSQSHATPTSNFSVPSPGTVPTAATVPTHATHGTQFTQLTHGTNGGTRSTHSTQNSRASQRTMYKPRNSTSQHFAYFTHNQYNPHNSHHHGSQRRRTGTRTFTSRTPRKRRSHTSRTSRSNITKLHDYNEPFGAGVESVMISKDHELSYGTPNATDIEDEPTVEDTRYYRRITAISKHLPHARQLAQINSNVAHPPIPRMSGTHTAQTQIMPHAAAGAIGSPGAPGASGAPHMPYNVSVTVGGNANMHGNLVSPTSRDMAAMNAVHGMHGINGMNGMHGAHGVQGHEEDHEHMMDLTDLDRVASLEPYDLSYGKSHSHTHARRMQLQLQMNTSDNASHSNTASPRASPRAGHKNGGHFQWTPHAQHQTSQQVQPNHHAQGVHVNSKINRTIPEEGSHFEQVSPRSMNSYNNFNMFHLPNVPSAHSEFDGERGHKTHGMQRNSASQADMVAIVGPEFDTMHHDEGPRVSLSAPTWASSMMTPHYDVVLKVMYTVPIGFFLAPVVLLEGEKYPLQCIAVIMVIIKLLWFTFFLYTILSAKKLRHFRSLLCVFNDFSNISIPYGIKEYPTVAVTSVSQLLAIRGSFWQLAIISESVVTFFFCMFGVLLRWDLMLINEDKGGVPGGYIGGVLAYLAPFGVFIGAVWELNHKSKVHMGFHYFGVLLMSLGVFPLALLTHWSLISILLIVGYFGSIFLWLTFSSVLPKTSNNPEIVHITSLYCLITEVAATIFVTISIIWYIFRLGDFNVSSRP